MLAGLRQRLTYSNVMATIAVFVALGGTSYAVATGSIDSREIKNNTVRSKDIRNNSVTSRDLRNNSASGSDVRNDSLTGDDILESSFGTVPSANRADTAARAETATSASTASNASALEGLGPDAFLRSNRVTLRDPVPVDDPADDGSLTRTTLMTEGPVTIEGECADQGSQRQGTLRAFSSSPGTLFAGSGSSTSGEEHAVGQIQGDHSLIFVAGSTPRWGMGTFAFHHPGSGTYLLATMFVSVNSAGDCAFAITAIG